MINARKVNKQFENPIDNFLISINEKLNPIYNHMRMNDGQKTDRHNFGTYNN